MSGKFWWAGMIGVTIAAIVWIAYPNQSQSPKPKSIEPEPRQRKPGGFDSAKAERALVDEGWSQAAAEAVVSLNARFFTILFEDDSPAWKNALARLQTLGQHPGLMVLLERHPEVAGLLAGAPDPVAVAAPLYDARHYDQLASLYVRYAADLDSLALALRDHKHVMIRLQEAGLAGAEVVFLYPRTGKAVAEYGRWLDEMLRRAIRRGEDDLIAALGIVLSQGTEIRRRMEDDTRFRQRFDDEIWPRFERLVDRGHLTWEQAAWDNHLFDLLALPEGEALVVKWGMLPSHILFGPDLYPASLHPRIITAMQSGDNHTLEALLRFGQRKSFRKLLDREGLSDGTLAAALNQLRQVSDVNIPEKLEFFESLSDDALAEEVGPPPSGPVTWLPLYDSYEVTKKLLQGRPVSGMDWGFAIADPALMFLGPAKAGTKGAKILTTTLKNHARKQATKQLGQHAVKLSEKELAPWLFSQTLRRVRQQAGDVLKKKLTMEITGPVRYFYRATGFGRETFKNLTKLEARLFMRADAKVLVRLDRLNNHPALKRFFKETAKAALQQNAPWQQNVSAWWFINAVGLAR